MIEIRRFKVGEFTRSIFINPDNVTEATIMEDGNGVVIKFKFINGDVQDSMNFKDRKSAMSFLRKAFEGKIVKLDDHEPEIIDSIVLDG